MRKSIFTLVFILLTMIAYTQSFWPCVFKTGKIGVQETNGIYKIFIQEEHTNECFVSDSTITYISIYCKESNTTIGERVEVGDTLTYKLGTVIIAGSTRWYFGNNWYMCSFSSTYIFGNNYCVEEIVDVPLPPVVTPVVTVINGLIESNVMGTLVVLEYPSYQPYFVKTYDTSFSYQLPTGWYYVYIILSDGSLYEIGVVEN